MKLILELYSLRYQLFTKQYYVENIRLWGNWLSIFAQTFLYKSFNFKENEFKIGICILYIVSIITRLPPPIHN
jgi:hypothetical protein